LKGKHWQMNNLYNPKNPDLFVQMELEEPMPPELNIVSVPEGSVVETGSLSSPNYRPGSSGWSIDSAGNAEFQSITVNPDFQTISIISPTDTPRVLADTERTFSGVGAGAAVLKKQFTIHFPGRVRFYCELKNDTPPRAAYADWQLNGTQFWETSNNTNAYVSSTHDLSVDVNDVIEVFCWVGNVSNGYIRNVRVCYDLGTLDPTGTVDTD